MTYTKNSSKLNFKKKYKLKVNTNSERTCGRRHPRRKYIQNCNFFNSGLICKTGHGWVISAMPFRRESNKEQHLPNHCSLSEVGIFDLIQYDCSMFRAMWEVLGRPGGTSFPASQPETGDPHPGVQPCQTSRQRVSGFLC